MPKKKIAEIKLSNVQDGCFVVYDEYDREDHYPVLYYKNKSMELRLGWFDPERIGPELINAHIEVQLRYLDTEEERNKHREIMRKKVYAYWQTEEETGKSK